MERPAKRQKVSQETTYIDPRPTRTIDLTAFQRQPVRRRNHGNVLLPRVPDVTVTAGLLDIAINDDPVTTQIAVPTVSLELSLGSLGTVVLPELTTATTASTITASNSSTSSYSTVTGLNATNTTTETTVTVTETSTFRISYHNGTFIAPTATVTNLLSSDDSDFTITDSDSAASTLYVFGGASTDSYASATSTSGPYIGGAVPGSTDSGSSPSSTSTSGSDSPVAPVLTQQQTQMVGGIVGGVAGIALVFIAMLYFLRWYRERLKRLGRLQKGLGSSAHDSKDYSGAGLVESAAPIAQYSKHFIHPSSMSMKKLRSASDIASLTTVESEKGFSRLSGRKIAPVLTTGGDQYGGSYGVFEKEIDPSIRSPASSKRNDFSEGSFYRDSDGVYYGTGRSVSRSEPNTPKYPPVFVDRNTARRPSLADIEGKDFAPHDFDHALRRNMTKADGVAVFRGSPARTPVTQSPTTSSLKLPVQAPVTMDSDIPEMPLPSPGLGHDLMRNRNFSRLSARSTASGKFKEDLS